jgi:hypothetical protein
MAIEGSYTFLSEVNGQCVEMLSIIGLSEDVLPYNPLGDCISEEDIFLMNNI